jgi:hypothetical protein
MVYPPRKSVIGYFYSHIPSPVVFMLGFGFNVPGFITANIEYRRNESYLFIKKIEQRETSFRNSAVHCSAVLRVAFHLLNPEP